ncbi:MAG: hypothetical protein EOO61_02555 [Hymenobacter sp.]|nr:MAG: hypothetical protein EOO61_02555 [Hymenobacter sp.]
MAFAILRVEKIKSAANAAAKTGHNYRLHAVPNADASRQPLNQELVNHTQRPLWELAEARVAELGLKRLRADAVKAVEVLLTASPEAFPRDAQGQAVDMRGSAWLAANQQFLTERFGGANVVALTLHQDEQTPHLHAVVVPVTADGRLSARDVFNPASLRQLQTAYSQAMQAAGFQVQRGIEGSTAKHESVRAYYGALQANAEQLAMLPPEQLLATAAVVLRAQQRHQVQQQQLAAAQAVKQRNYEQMQQAQAQQQAKAQELAEAQTVIVKNKVVAAVWAAQGNAPEAFITAGHEVRTKQKEIAEKLIAFILQKPIYQQADLIKQLQNAPGYLLEQSPDTKKISLTHQESGSRFDLSELKPGGFSVKQAYEHALVRTQQQAQQLAAEPSHSEPEVKKMRGPRQK